LQAPDILQVNLNSYTLGSSFCRQHLTTGGVIIFVKNNIKFGYIESTQFCKEQDIECCPVQSDIKLSKLCFIALHGAHSRDFGIF
jgi:hypothetical protein